MLKVVIGSNIKDQGRLLPFQAMEEGEAALIIAPLRLLVRLGKQEAKGLHMEHQTALNQGLPASSAADASGVIG